MHIVDEIEAFLDALAAEQDFMLRCAMKEAAPSRDGITWAGYG